jgi:DNA-binding transcriptional LysR family regulator
VEIGYVASAAISGVLPRLVHRFRRERPGTEVRLHEMDMVDQVDAIEQGRLDAGFVRPPLPLPESVSLATLLEEPMCAVLHKDHPRAFDAQVDVRDLRGDTFICTHRRPGVGFYAITREICLQAGFEPKTDVFSPQATVLISMVAAGFGVALVPASARAFSPADVVFRPLAGTAVRSKLSVIGHRRHASPAAAAFMACANVAHRPPFNP